MTNKPVNLLFTSAGRRGYLMEYFKTALNGNGSIHAANSEPAPAFSSADFSVVTPLIYSPEYIPFLLDYCRKNEIRAVIPLFDIDLPVLAASRDQFTAIGTELIVSTPEVLAVCNDKWNMVQYLKTVGLRAPATFLHLEEAEAALACGGLSFPLIVKPRWGMGSIGIYQADTPEELRVFYHKVHQEVFATYLKYESAADRGSSVLIQQKLDGQEYGLDIINDLAGGYRNTIVKRKYAMRSGETDRAATVRSEELEAAGRQLGTALRHTANLDADAFLQDGQVFIIDMNARFGGGYPFSHMAGANLPLAIVRWLRKEPVDDSLLSAEPGIMSQKIITVQRIG